MNDVQTVTLIKRCLRHGIEMPRQGALAARFQTAFPAASYDSEAGEWQMEWKKGHFAESNDRLEAFFADNGVAVTHVNKC